MKTFSLNIIDDKVDISNRDGLGSRFISVLISIAVLIGLISFASVGWSIFLFFIVLIIASHLTRRAQRDWLTLQQCTGRVDFSDKTISLSILSYNIQLGNISQIKLFGDYYQGFTINSSDIVHNGLYSIIIIISADGKQCHFKFVVFNKNEYQELSDFFEFLYGNFKSDIVEKIGSEHQTGFLLRHDRSYKNIQDLKQRFLIGGK